MELTDEIKAKIDAMTYEEMFAKQRFSPLGDPMFQGEVGDYFIKRMHEIRPSAEEHSRISKKLGW